MGNLREDTDFKQKTLKNSRKINFCVRNLRFYMTEVH